MKTQKPFVVYIITELELGGAQKVCLALFDHMPSHEITTGLITSNKGLLVEKIKDKHNVFMLPSLHRNISIKTFFNEFSAFLYIIKILRQLKKANPSIIVHTHSTKAGILGRWAAFFAQISTRVHTIHGYAFHPHQSWIKWLPIYLIELFTSLITTHFVCVSTADVKIGKKLFPGFNKKHSIIRAAVDLKTSLHSSGAPKTAVLRQGVMGVFVFGTIACFKPQKNLIDLLRAFTFVHNHNPATRLEIIGDGIMRPQIEQWIHNHNVQHVVTLHGWQSDVLSIIKQWHVFTLSSLWEGLPCAIIEARMLKLPVICYDTGGIADVIHDGKNGLLCSQKNWQQLANNMLLVANDKNLYEKLSQFPDQLDAFSYNFMVNEHKKLYEKFLFSLSVFQKPI